LSVVSQLPVGFGINGGLVNFSWRILAGA